MRIDARVQEVISLLADFDLSKPADDYLHLKLKTKRYIGSSDRRWIRDFFYKILRHQVSLKFQLFLAAQRDLHPEGREAASRMMLILYLMRFKDIAVESVFTGDKYAPVPLLEEECNLLKYGKDVIAESLTHESIRCELPEFWYERLHAKYGKRLPDLCLRMNEEAPLDLRINTLKTSVKHVIELLRLRGVEAVPTPYAPFGVRIQNGRSAQLSDLITQGLFEPQDEGSQLISFMCDAQPGMRVVDFCAGAGGKTLSLAMHMENKGTIVASDVAEYRLSRAKERLNRLEVHNTSLKVIDNDWIKRHAGTFDRVLIDAPCSGSGTWRRNPDLKLRLGERDVQELSQKQREIMKSASRLVKKGGRLIYATCSLLDEENDHQVQLFLNHSKDFCQLNLTKQWKGRALPPCDTVTWSLTPLDHATDGFFIAVMERMG